MWFDISKLPITPVLGTMAVVAGLWLAHWLLIRRSKEMGAGKRFPRQLWMLGLSGLALVIMIVVLTGGDQELRNVLLSGIAVLFSAVLGLSSTTFISNAMAGLLLRMMRNFHAGDFIRIGEEFGRVTEKGLFHTEIQTEDRDLVTLPNFYVATNPIRVVRSSGTIVSATLSLGYDVARLRVENLLKQAAEDAELQEPFVHIIELGDFSISYRVSGFLPEVRQLRTARSNLRKTAVDRLHGDGIEIVSPHFMNQRPLDRDSKIIPAKMAAPKPKLEDDDQAEAIIFDKADEAEAKETLQYEREQTTAKLEELKKARRDCKDDQERAGIDAQIEEAERRRDEIGHELEQAEAPDGEDERQ
jgi:small conductance mechanosensitive channel